MHRKTLGIICDQPIMVEGLAYVFSSDPNFRLASRGRNASDIYKIAEHRPHVILLDMDNLGGGLPAIHDCRLISPETKVVAYSASPSVDLAAQTMMAGAAGYIIKSSTVDELTAALSIVANGGTFISPGFSIDLMDALTNTPIRQASNPKVLLSVREDQIVRMLLVGKTNKQIATLLNISERTVKHYMSVLMQKLQARNRMEVVAAARNIEELFMDGKQQPRRGALPN